MVSDTPSAVATVILRLQAALNEHDLDAIAACFASDYQSAMPVHPGAEFVGRDQVRRNWATILNTMPDFRAELLYSVTEGDTACVEWRWHGTRQNGIPMEMRGVTLIGIRRSEIAWARLYMEPVLVANVGGIDAQVEKHMHEQSL